MGGPRLGFICSCLRFFGSLCYTPKPLGDFAGANLMEDTPRKCAFVSVSPEDVTCCPVSPVLGFSSECLL